jgi:hypothetical protein
VQGMATPGLVDAQAAAALSGPPLWVLVTDTAPQDAYVAVQYDSRWFWTADTDIQSKNTFAIICCCFRLPIPERRGSAPVVTTPAQRASYRTDHMRTKPITYRDRPLAEPIGISAGIPRRIGARLLPTWWQPLCQCGVINARPGGLTVARCRTTRRPSAQNPIGQTFDPKMRIIAGSQALLPSLAHKSEWRRLWAPAISLRQWTCSS